MGLKIKYSGQLSWNGGSLAPGEFAYCIGPTQPWHSTTDWAQNVSEIVMPCRGGKYANCVLRIRRGEPDNNTHTFKWDGNIEEPTLTPSIGCDHRCGWHGNLTKGELNP